IVIFHGDLGTGERIRSIRQRRSIEDTVYDRKQMVFFCPGLFHCKMACIDTLHRIFIKPEQGRKDESSLMHDAKILRPKETHILTTKPGFRRMHQMVNHSGICRRLDCWGVLAEQMNPSHTSLEHFAKSQPMLEDLKKMADQLAADFTCNEDLSLARLMDSNKRDEIFENATLVLKYFALYEEFAWAMNVGDIGRIEKCLLPWIAMSKGTGKHKYATHLEQFLTTVHFDLPPDMRHAVRYNWLINATGKPGKFRAADWYVELHNLQIKVTHGGEGPNRTIKRIVTESALVGKYKTTQQIVERNFLLTNETTAHTEPDMGQTFAELLAHYQETSPHTFTLGRKSHYSIEDVLGKGHELML
ncbi:hypothetical protein JOM56_014847, partial [Amanita muscaria]